MNCEQREKIVKNVKKISAQFDELHILNNSFFEVHFAPFPR